MVNDFESTLKVTGPKADVDQFIVDYKVGKKTFMYMVEPYPKIYDLLDEYFLGNLDSDKLFTNQTYLSIPEEIRNPHQKGEIPFYKFDWTMNHSHWGTKFMCYNNSKERISDNEVIFSFCTASTPINPYIGALLHHKYPTLSFSYGGEDEGWPENNFKWRFLATDECDLEFEKIVDDLYNHFLTLANISMFMGQTFNQQDISKYIREKGYAQYPKIIEAHKKAVQYVADRIGGY